MTVTATLTTHSLAVSQKMKIHRYVGVPSVKRKKPDSPKRIPPSRWRQRNDACYSRTKRKMGGYLV
ncbi:unnamed protein product [Callosobruchus maculatus]|uniref:Uncharacterized protein n=1 Tax=Callosobruchus maculatus TaxID=64391 RepID=A0A653C6D3_CALMS|nr:unnamed protein product [Callosobruchus maculatus]